MAEILVEKLGVPALYLANKAVMALYGGGQMTGVAVDSGQDPTYIVPTLQGSPIQVLTYQTLPYLKEEHIRFWIFSKPSTMSHSGILAKPSVDRAH